MTMLSNHARVCPRCTNPGFPGWLIREADGYIHCISCGYTLFDPGFHHTSFRVMFFAHIRPDDCEEIHHTERRKEDYPSPALERISYTLESCCRKHGDESGRLPICKECEWRYDALAEKSVDDRIDSTDIFNNFKFRQEAMKI